jgi:hypothetical protein
MAYGTINVDTLTASTGVLATQNGMTGIPKAWVQFNGVGGATIANSFNISSVTRASTGLYTINFTTSMPNSNYGVSITGGCALNVVGGFYGEYTTSASTPNQRTTSSVPVFFQAGTSNAGQDNCVVSVSVFSS